MFSVHPREVVFAAPRGVAVMSGVDYLYAFFCPFLERCLFSVPLTFVGVGRSGFVGFEGNRGWSTNSGAISG